MLATLARFINKPTRRVALYRSDDGYFVADDRLSLRSPFLRFDNPDVVIIEGVPPGVTGTELAAKFEAVAMLTERRVFGYSEASAWEEGETVI